MNSTQNNKTVPIVVFTLLEKEFGVDIQEVREVLRSKEVSPLPKAPLFIKGIINLRGHVVAVMDLRKRLDLHETASPTIETEEDPRYMIIIVKLKQMVVGIMVDSISGVLDIPMDAIEPTPEIVATQIKEGYIKGVAKVDKRMIVILDIERILSI